MNDKEIMICQDLIIYFKEHPLLFVGLVGFSIAVFDMFAYADKINMIENK